MDDLPLPALFVALSALLLLSAFFSMSETVMMAANRYRLKHKAGEGDGGARRALDLLATTDRLLGIILLVNTLANAGAATLAGVISIQLLGDEKWVLGASTLLVTFMMLVFSEITPKVVGAGHADRLAPILAYALTPLLRSLYPVVWFANLFVRGLLFVLRIRPAAEDAHSLSREEIRALVLEARHLGPAKHHSILMNLFDLEDITMEDVMTPRGSMEMIDLAATLDDIRQHLATAYHTRLPAFDDDPDRVVGILHLRRVLASALSDDFSLESLKENGYPDFVIDGGSKLAGFDHADQC